MNSVKYRIFYLLVVSVLEVTVALVSGLPSAEKKRVTILNFIVQVNTINLQGVSKKPQDKEMEKVSYIVSILISSQENI